MHDAQEVKLAEAWLAQQRPAARVGKRFTSWHLRRMAERWHRLQGQNACISDAAFHEAVKRMGLSHAPAGPVFMYVALEVVQ